MKLVMESVGTVHSATLENLFVTLSVQKWPLLLHYWVCKTPATDAMQDVEVDKHKAIDAGGTEDSSVFSER